MSIVTPEVVQQVAQLARIRVEGNELAHLASQLDQILVYIQQLQEVPTEQVQPTSHVLPLTDVLREDTLRPSLDQAVAASMAPTAHPPFVTVPKVIGAD